MIVLPQQKVLPSEINPRFLIIFSKPKAGKTSLLAGLPKCLIIDLEDGTDYYEAYRVKAKTLDDLAEIREALKANPNMYDYIAIDTGTALEEVVMPLAVALYKATPMGKNYKGSDVRELANGAGYLYTREAFTQIVNTFRGLCRYFILTGHVKDKYIEKEGTETTQLELDLTGKLKSITSADADAIAYLYRKGKGGNETWLNFVANDGIICGARPNHLKNKEIKVAESDANGNITYHWDEIYLK